MSLFFGVVVFAGLAIAWSATFWARREAPRWGLVDHPGGRKAHRAPTPTGGGLAIWLALVGALISGQTVPWAVAGGGEAANGLGVLSPGPRRCWSSG